MDNVIVAYEAMHSMNKRIKGKYGFMALKLDMSNAYDMVEWKFIKVVMIKMGFHLKWVYSIMRCINFTSYYILINGSLQASSQATKGIRKGDPFLPYMFILCSEALSALLNQFEATKSISGIPIASGKIFVNHLFFADDSLLFYKSNALEWSRLIDILTTYEQASGERLNKEKTYIHLSNNKNEESKRIILSIVGVRSSLHMKNILSACSYR